MRRRVTDFAARLGAGTGIQKPQPAARLPVPAHADSCLQKGGRLQTWRQHRTLSQLDDRLVRNLPSEGLHLLLLSEVFLEEDGLAGIGRERARRGQHHTARAIVHLDPATEQTNIVSHVTSL